MSPSTCSTHDTHEGPARPWARRWWAVGAVVGLMVLAGCSSGSSKPAYCSDRASLESSIKGLTGLSVNDGISGLQSQLSKVQSDANALVSSAKSDFPSQTSAISSSVSTLQSEIASLSSSPSAADLAIVAKDAANVVTAVNTFMDATKSKCS